MLWRVFAGVRRTARGRCPGSAWTSSYSNPRVINRRSHEDRTQIEAARHAQGLSAPFDYGAFDQAFEPRASVWGKLELRDWRSGPGRRRRIGQARQSPTLARR